MSDPTATVTPSVPQITAADMLAHYMAAEVAILGGQSYRWGERQLTRADLAEVIKGRNEWQRRAAIDAGGGLRVRLANFSGVCGAEGSQRSSGYYLR